MAKKRGLAANRGLDALLGSIKKEKQLTATALKDDMTAHQDAVASAAQPASTPATSKHDDGISARNAAADRTQAKDIASEASDDLGASAKQAQTAARPTTNKRKTARDTTPARSTRSRQRTQSHSQADLQSNVAGNNAVNDAAAGRATDTDAKSQDDQISLVQIEVGRLQAGKYQPRRDMSETALTELASSIEQHGVMQPIVIRPLLASEDKSSAGVTHEIIAGERRWRAAKMANKTVIPAIERALSDELAIALALIENIQREDLSVIEQAAALQRFHSEFGMSHAMIADVVGKARTTVSNLLRLNQLHDTVKDHLANSALDMGHARTLLALSSEQQPIIAQKIIDAKMTVREAEKLVKSILQPQATSKRTAQSESHDLARLTQRLTDALGAKVKLKHKKDGQGSVEIIFNSEAELATIIEHIAAKS